MNHFTSLTADGAQDSEHKPDAHNRCHRCHGGAETVLPVNRALGVKIAYIGTKTYASTGLDSDTLTFGFSVMW